MTVGIVLEHIISYLPTGRHQKSCTALVVALTLLSEGSPIMGGLLDRRTCYRERIDGTWRSLLGMIRALSPSNGCPVG